MEANQSEGAEQMDTKRIFIIGSINTDIVIQTPKMPQSGETITGSGFFVAQGGKGANQAVAAARLGGQVTMCGCVGRDTFAAGSLEALRADGVDTTHIRQVDAPSGIAMIIVCEGDNRIILDKGANACLTTADIDAALEQARPGDLYLTQLENPIEVIGYGLQKAHEKGMYVILNPAPACEEIRPYLHFCDLLTPNETETQLLGGKQALLQQVPTLLVTLGSKGFAIVTKDGEQTYPCQKIEPVDTTAAGDTLCGGLCAYLAEGHSLEEAAKFGSAAATLACTRKGAQPSIPTRKEVK